MTELALSLKITADAGSAASGIKVTRDELKNFRDEFARVGVAQGAAATSQEALRQRTEQYVKTLATKVATLGMTRSELLRYEAAQLQLSAAEQKAVVGMQQSIDAHQKKDAAMGQVISTLGRMGVAAGLAAIAMAGVVAKAGIDEAIEAAKAQVKLESALKATGYAAGLTHKELDTLADGLAEKTTYGDEDFRNAIAALLKFKNVQGETFKEAIQWSADYAASTGTDLVSAAQAVGKALQDTEGITRLSVATGGRFSESMIDQIKGLRDAGREQEAVALTLQGLKQSINGTAEAMNTGLIKAQADSKKAWGELLEAIGQTDIVGGSYQKSQEHMTQLFGILKGAVKGTDSTLLDFTATVMKLTPFTYSAALMLERMARAQDRNQGPRSFVLRYGSTQAVDPVAEAENEARVQAKLGAAAQELAASKEAQAAKDKIASAEKAKALAAEAKAYEGVKQSASNYLVTLEQQLLAEGATVEQKIMLTAATHAMTLKTNEERSAYLARAAVIAHQIQLNGEEIKAKKDLLEQRNRMLDAQAKELDSIDKEIQKQKEKNYELLNGADSYKTYAAAALEAAADEQAFWGATEEDLAATRTKIRLLRELASLKSTGDAIEGAQKAEQEFFKNMEADAARWGAIFEDVITQAFQEGGVKGSDIIKSLFNSMELRPAIQGLSADLGRLAAGGQVSQNFGMNLATVGGTYAGSQGASALGAGQRGQQVGAIAGGYGAQAGFLLSGGSPIGAIVGALLGAVIGKFTDPDGDAVRRGHFGSVSAVGDRNAQSFTSRLGQFGIGDTQWFSDDMKGSINNFFQTLKTIDDTLAAKMTDAQRATASGALNNARSYGFGMERTDVNASSAFPEIFRERYAAVLDSLGAGFGDFLRASQGTVQEMGNIVDAVLNLSTAGADLDQVIAGLAQGAIPNLTGQLDAMETQVANAQSALNAAVASRDPAGVYAAEQQLQTAIVQRYQTERAWVQQLADSLVVLRQQAYDFQITMAQKINAAGGNANISGIAQSRAFNVRNSLGNISDPAARITAINSYVSAVDTDYQARRTQIIAAAQRDQAAAAAAAQAAQQQAQAQAAMQAAIAQAQIAAAQEQLQLAQAWAGVLGQTRQMIESLRYSTASPASAQSRYGSTVTDSNALFAQFQAASGQQRIDLAARLLPVLQQRQQLLAETEQRPSAGYATGYSQINAMLAEVEQYARTQADRAEALQGQMVSLQAQSNTYAAAAAVTADASNLLLDELNAQYRDQIQFALTEGEAAYAQQEALHAELLQQITGGMEVDLFVAQLQQRATDALEEIKGTIALFLAGTTAASGGAIVPAPGGGSPGGGGGGGGGGIGEVNITINAPPEARAIAEVVLNVINQRLPQIRRDLQTS